jgi:hypothetical protein
MRIRELVRPRVGGFQRWRSAADRLRARAHGGRPREWFGRYAPAEAAAVLGALLAATMANRFGVAAATAFAGAIGEGVAFYAVLFIRDLRRRSTLQPRGRAVSRTLRDLLTEFGPAELLDTLAVRPLAMYVGPIVVGDMTAGIILGKVAADVVFYTLAIIGYEARKSVTQRRSLTVEPVVTPWP